jgi:hypothetical protein
VLKRVAALPEVWFTAAIVALMALLSLTLGLPVSLPSGERAQFVGIHYLYPLIGVGVWGLFALFGQRRRLARTFLVALPCYAIVLLCHFNLKLWIPHVNPAHWDGLYWSIDQALSPLVTGCMALRRFIAPAVPLESNMYMIAFITMFYLSFCYHALRTPEQFRTLFLAALLFQGLGALAYMVMPAIGPFIYQAGVEPAQTGAQLGMLQSYRENLAGGAGWIAANGGAQITVGLAAMPSLHCGGSFLFLLFAWRYAKPLVPLYCLLFGFIAVDAVANRWHYLIDVPVGMALSWGCAWAAERLAACGPVDGEVGLEAGRIGAWSGTFRRLRGKHAPGAIQVKS